MFLKINPLKILTTVLKSDLLLPIFLLLTYIAFLLIVRGSFPTTDQLITTFSHLYQTHGYLIIFIAAFLEALAVVNLFVPGGIALTLGVIFARTGQTELTLVILTGASAAILGYLVDYTLGYYGFSEVLKKTSFNKFVIQTGSKIKKYGKKSLIISFIQANIGSFASLAAGTIKFDFKVFITIAIIATFFWSTLWAILIFIFGEVILNLLRKYGFLIILVSIVGAFLSKLWEEKE